MYKIDYEGSLLEAIQKSIMEDDERPDKIENALLDLYESSSEEQQCLIDCVLVILTGYNLNNLVKLANTGSIGYED